MQFASPLLSSAGSAFKRLPWAANAWPKSQQGQPARNHSQTQDDVEDEERAAPRGARGEVAVAAEASERRINGNGDGGG